MCETKKFMKTILKFLKKNFRSILFVCFPWYLYILPCKRQKKMMKTMLENVDKLKKKKNVFICFFVCHARAKMIFKNVEKNHNLDIYFLSKSKNNENSVIP